jgi:gas vesicle protein
MRLNQVTGFVSGLLSGAIVGTAVVVLLAPQSGAETRSSINSKIQGLLDAGKQAAADRRQELRREYQEAIRIPIPISEPDQA